MNKLKKATTLLILAGGMGSRYKSQKQVDSLNSDNATLMEFALYDAIKVGIRKFVFIINDQFPVDYQEKITQLLVERKCEARFIEQTLNRFIPSQFQCKLENRLKPLGTAHAVYCAKEIIQEPFITMNADDFYGFKTFEKAVHYIETGKIAENHFAMCAFELENTLSENGSVSRGICQLSNQKLTKVEEFTQIKKIGDTIQGLNEKLQEQILQGKDSVSMNFWILHPSFFKMAESDLVLFLEQHNDLSKVEFYLPSVVDKAIQENKINVEVLPTSEKWFGLTYPSDKELVVEELKLMKSNEIYPSQLWEGNHQNS